ncbi:MAG: hypothetical protein O7D30_09420, partial [Rickettsia endosymbiont of Ixodes persulcatus]|nr:hypothetical protein [Rickettsia endosymbiont of Ixodes persulcatus]
MVGLFFALLLVIFVIFFLSFNATLIFEQMASFSAIKFYGKKEMPRWYWFDLPQHRLRFRLQGKHQVQHRLVWMFFFFYLISSSFTSFEDSISTPDTSPRG